MTKKSSLLVLALVVSVLFVSSCLTTGSASAGKPASAKWGVTTGEDYTDVAVVAGALTANAIKMEGVVYNSTKFEGARITTPTNVWEKMTARDDARYVEFSVPGANGLVINDISMKIGSSGTSNMQWDILYSTEADFSNATALIEKGTAGTKDTLKSLVLSDFYGDLGVAVEDGKTFYVRIYPFLGSDGSGKYMLLSDVTISGATN